MSPRLSQDRNAISIGVDVGTTSVKAAAFSIADTSRPIAVARRTASTHSPATGWSETDPHRLLENTLNCIRDVAIHIDAARVVSIGISGTACGAWLIDSSGELVRPPILWNDGRAASILREWNQTGFTDDIFTRSGNAIFSGYTLPVLAWLEENEPDAVTRSANVLFCKDWLRFRLTGVIGTDASDASFAPFNIAARQWDQTLFARGGVSSTARILPPILDDDRCDPLTDVIAQRLRLPASTVVSVGATDIVASLIGVGATNSDTAVTILGTSANSSIVTDQPHFDPVGVGIMAAMPHGQYCRTMVTASGSATLDWMANLLTEGDVSRLLALAERSAADVRPTLVPDLSAAGAVSPRPNPHSQAVLVGLRSHHTAADLARSAVEGLALAIAECYAVMQTQPERIIAVGGAARSNLLLQTIADATGSTVTRPTGEEFGARGVALLALKAIGLLSLTELRTAASHTLVDKSFAPEHNLQRSQQHYADARAATQHLWDSW